MNKENKILDELGKLVIDEVIDNNLEFLFNPLDKLKQVPDYKYLFSLIDEKALIELRNLSREFYVNIIFGLFRMIEEQSSNDGGKFKLIYEEDGKQYDLTKIGEGNLKAEPIIEGGWIDRYSKYGRPKENILEEDDK